jgi:F-type H+-transporting ATPase subunit a
MPETQLVIPELPNSVTLLAQQFQGTLFGKYLYAWENIIFSLIIICILSLVAFFVSRKSSLIPGKLQSALEAFVGGADDFICGILGPKGRKYTPFIGTLFIYIICMNLFGIIPFMKSSTTSWSTTLALALCVFFYVQFAAIKERGLMSYLDHLMGKPRGFLAFSVVIPLLMFSLHVLTELVRPVSLSLRLRSNIWGDDILLAIIAGFGLKGIPMLFFNSLLVILAGVVQAVVFCLLTTIYFALAITEE